MAKGQPDAGPKEFSMTAKPRSRKGCILAVDAGTSSLRCVMINLAGRVLHAAQRHYAPTSFPDGRVEQDPNSWRSALMETLSEIAPFTREEGLPVEAICLTSQRSSVMAVDADGKPLTPCLMWHDKRSQGICDRLRGHEADAYGRTGLRMAPMFSAPKMAWIRENLPEVFAGTHKFFGVHEFLLYQLCGDFVTDRSIASRSLLLNLASGEWDADQIALFGLDRNRLCRLVDPGEACGTLSGWLAAETGLPSGIPIVPAGGDQQCAVLGMGITAPGMVSTTVGTGAFTIGLAEKPAWDPNMRYLANVAAQRGRWILETPLLTAGNAYNWLAEQFMDGEDAGARLREADRLAAESVPGANGVRVLPYMEGRGAPSWNTAARGAFLNVSLATKKCDFARAMMEAIALDISDNMTVIREAGMSAGGAGNSREDGMLLSGGLCRQPMFNQIVADACGCAVTVRENREATALGAWAVASAAVGTFPDAADAIACALRGIGSTTWHPVLSMKALYRAVREESQSFYQRLYPFC